MANAFAAYVYSPQTWSFDSLSYDSSIGFYTNAWLDADGEMPNEDESNIVNDNSCSYFYQIGKEDETGFTPNRIMMNDANGILTIEGKQKNVASNIIKSFRMNSPSPRFLNLRDSRRNRRPARFNITSIITDADDELVNIKEYLGLNEEEAEAISRAEEYEYECLNCGEGIEDMDSALKMGSQMLCYPCQHEYTNAELDDALKSYDAEGFGAEGFKNCDYCRREIDLSDNNSSYISCEDCGKIACGSYKCNQTEQWDDFLCGECSNYGAEEFGAEDDFAYFNKYRNFEKNGIPIIDDGYELSWGLASLTQRELIEEILGSFEYDYLLENNMVVKVDDVEDAGWDNLGDLFGAESESDDKVSLRVWAKDMEKDHLGYFVSKNKDGWETWKGLCGITTDKGVSRGFNVSNYDGSYGRRCRKCLTAYKKSGQRNAEEFGAEERIENRITQTTGLDWQTDFNNMSEGEQKVWVDNADPNNPTAVKVDGWWDGEWVCLHCGDSWETQAAALRCAEWDGHVLEGREEWKDKMIEKYGAEEFGAESFEAKGARKCTKHFWELASRKNPISGGMQFFNQCVLCGKKNFSRGGSAMSDRGFFAE